MDAAPGTEDEDDDLESCYRHPGRLTAVHCSNCGRPICPDCMIAAPVGIKCPECGTMPRSALARVPTGRLASGLAAGLVVAAIAGVVRVFLAPIPLLGIFIPWLLGMGVGEVTVRAAGGFRDPMLARGAAACAAIGIVAGTLLLVHHAGAVLASPWTWIAAAIAAFGAYQRAS